MTTCKNCSTTFDGKFCPNCSQKATTSRFTLVHLGHDLNHALTHTDKGIFFLMKELCFKPGIVAREFIEGKRKKYFNPLTYLLLLSTITVVSSQYTRIHDRYADKIEESMRSLARFAGDAGLQEKTETDMEYARKQMAVAQENQKIMTLAFVPVLALMTWLLFRKSKYNYAENLVFNIFLMGQTLLFFIGLCIIPVLISPGAVITVMMSYTLLCWIYYFIAYQQFFGERWRWVILKGLVIQIVYATLVMQVSALYLKLFA